MGSLDFNRLEFRKVVRVHSGRRFERHRYNVSFLRVRLFDHKIVHQVSVRLARVHDMRRHVHGVVRIDGLQERGLYNQCKRIRARYPNHRCVRRVNDVCAVYGVMDNPVPDRIELRRLHRKSHTDRVHLVHFDLYVNIRK